MAGASKPTTVSTRQQRIAELAKQSPEMGFTSLAHHIDLVWLSAAYQRTRKDGAVGVDGQTADAYADDFVMGFTCEEDARRVLAVLPKRFAKYGLTVHPEKTRLVPFRPPAGSNRPPTAAGSRPGTFDLLGFTHYWARSGKGNWVVKRRTAASRLRRAVRTIAQWCRTHCHEPLAWQHRVLGQKCRSLCPSALF
jgi:Reverse transcriptase (RNA-dependent DNA polymerase)